MKKKLIEILETIILIPLVVVFMIVATPVVLLLEWIIGKDIWTGSKCIEL